MNDWPSFSASQRPILMHFKRFKLANNRRASVSRRIAMKLFAVLLAVITSAVVHAAGLVRVSDGSKEYEGKVVSLSRTQCALIDRQGRLVRLSIRSLKSFENVSNRFEAEPVNEFRDALRAEFSGNYEVAGTTHYLVCAPKGRSKRYGDLFESIYRDVEHFYRVNGFEIHKPDVPLVAVVFGSQKEFYAYCAKDKVPTSAGLMGYYSLKTNRVALFDDKRLVSAVSPYSEEPEFSGLTSFAAYAGISGETANTIVHETTHQVGYNIGIHSRVGGTPLWVVEGLATVLEPDGMRLRGGRRQNQERVNEERLSWFSQEHRPKRSMGNLGKMVAADSPFKGQTLNSYSESWAFSYFLLENSARRRSLVSYLKKLSQRNAAKQYTAEQRLADFQDSFGDISRLEIEFIRFMDRL